MKPWPFPKSNQPVIVPQPNQIVTVSPLQSCTQNKTDACTCSGQNLPQIVLQIVFFFALLLKQAQPMT